MAITLLGFGKIGRAIYQDMISHTRDTQIDVYDPFGRFPEQAPSRVKFHAKDPFTGTNRKEIFRKGSVIVSALPAHLREELFLYAERNDSRLVDITFGNDPITKEKLSSRGDFIIIPDAGLAPGISNLLVGHLASKFEKVESIRIFVGGVPDRQIPPLNYKVVFSMDSVIDEYTNPCTIISGGRKKVVEALTGLEDVEFAGKKYEAFFTDGLRTLVHTMSSVENMFEKTVRYRGHCERVRLLRDLGFFSAEKIEIDGSGVSPRSISEAVLEKALGNPECGDTVLLRVIAEGRENGKMKKYTAEMIDSSPPGSELTSMARTTAFPASILTLMLHNDTGKLGKLSGYVPVENIGYDLRAFQSISGELAKRGINISIG